MKFAKFLTLATAFSMFALTLVVKAQTWTLEEPSNYLVEKSAHFGSCHVYLQHDGSIRLDSGGKVLGFKGDIYHNIELKLHGNYMIIANEFWLADENELRQVNAERPNLFWSNCGEYMSKLPDNFLSAFRGYHNLPLQTKK